MFETNSVVSRVLQLGDLDRTRCRVQQRLLPLATRADSVVRRGHELVSCVLSNLEHVRHVESQVRLLSSENVWRARLRSVVYECQSFQWREETRATSQVEISFEVSIFEVFICIKLKQTKFKATVSFSRQLKEINRDLLVDGQQPFASSLPHLNGFCLKYDYSYQMEFFYDALKSCKSSGNTLALVACMPTSIFSSDSQEKFLACTYSYRDCALELKSFLALADMARYPQLVDEKDLYVYVHSLTSNAASSTSTHVRFIQLALVVIISIVGGGSGGYTGI